MKAMGLFGCVIAPEYGGLGLSTSTYAKIIERISAVWMSISGIINSHLIMAMVVQRNGTDEQKAAFLPRFATGELRGGVGLTEPDCGTDLQAIRTVAKRVGDEYVVNGRKTWITNSLYGNCLALLVKTDPNAKPRHKGMSLLIAEKGPGFMVSRKLEKLGYKGIDTCELSFDDYKVPADRLIGGVEGRGLQQILNGLELGRINVAARGFGHCGRGPQRVDRLLSGAQDVRQADLRTPGDPVQAWRHGDPPRGRTPAHLSGGARLMTEASAATWKPGWRNCSPTEAAVENSFEAMRIHGAYGYSKEFNIERMYRDAPLLIIGEGTNEMQRIIIAKQLIERNPRMSLPLSGVRIVSVEQYGAGPFGTQHLADLGAEVIKIENFQRRRGHRAAPSGRSSSAPGDSHFYEAFNRNKRSLALDLKNPKARRSS